MNTPRMRVTDADIYSNEELTDAAFALATELTATGNRSGGDLEIQEVLEDVIDWIFRYSAGTD